MTMPQKDPFTRARPCGNCPYKRSSPLQLWHPAEYLKLIDAEQEPLGRVFMCHKKDGCVCVGWLADQDKRDFPSIMLRVELSRHNVTREYLDKLGTLRGLYGSVSEMIAANYPALSLEGLQH